MQAYYTLGLMSGTSLDGLDIAACTFEKTDNGWKYAITAAETFPYDAEFEQQLRHAHELSALELAHLNVKYGKIVGQIAKSFIDQQTVKPTLIGHHGHTVFHQPEAALTLQIGGWHELAVATGCKTVGDFRSKDVALGGQGAPLVPIGDELLFGNYDYCLNLGGIANISYRKDGDRIAFDISPANMALNELALRLGKPFDKDGEIAASGQIDTKLLARMNGLPFYESTGPKSLGREWYETQFRPLLHENANTSTEDLLSTVAEHIAQQVARSIDQKEKTTMLATGGGAFNQDLIARFRKHLPHCQIETADATLISFKEALVFAFLAVLRDRNEVNTLASVTGAKRDHSAGLIYHP